jgi:RNA polymerase sigma-70 factor, ECF subfamily
VIPQPSDQAGHRRRRGSEELLHVASTVLDPSGLDPVPDPSDRVVRLRLVTTALAGLSPAHRHAVVETYLRDRPRDQVAAELGIPEGTLRSRVHYALREMRATLVDLEAS